MQQHCPFVDQDGVLQEPVRVFHEDWGKWVDACGWEGEPRTPEVQKIVKSASHYYHKAGSYEIFDRFGRGWVLSEGFPSKKAAMPHIQKHLKKGLTDTDTGPYTALWWSSAGAYDRGTVIELENPDVT